MTYTVLRYLQKQPVIVASEGNKRRSGKFFVTGGPVLASCKTPLTRKALSCLYFRKTKSEKHIVSDLLVKNASVLSRHFEKSFYRRLLNSGDPLQWKCRNKDLVVVLSRLHTNRNKPKGSEDFNWNNIGLASLWFVWFCRHALFRLISCRLVIRTC